MSRAKSRRRWTGPSRGSPNSVALGVKSPSGRVSLAPGAASPPAVVQCPLARAGAGQRLGGLFRVIGLHGERLPVGPSLDGEPGTLQAGEVRGVDDKKGSPHETHDLIGGSGGCHREVGATPREVQPQPNSRGALPELRPALRGRSQATEDQFHCVIRDFEQGLPPNSWVDQPKASARMASLLSGYSRDHERSDMILDSCKMHTPYHRITGCTILLRNGRRVASAPRARYPLRDQ